MLWYNNHMKAVYSIKNKINNKIYIGSATNLTNRWSRHKSDLIQKHHHSVHLQRAWDKHGEQAFEFSILEEILESQDLIAREQHYIDLYKSYNPELGYNMSPTAGSCLGVIHTEEACKNMSKAHIKRYEDPLERQKTSKQTKESWTLIKREEKSKKMKEHWANPDNIKEQRKRMKEFTNNPEIAKKRSDGLKEHFKDPKNREKKSELCPHRRKIKHIETGNIYVSLDAAAKALPVTRTTIRNNLKGKFKSAKGYNFIEVFNE